MRITGTPRASQMRPDDATGGPSGHRQDSPSIPSRQRRLGTLLDGLRNAAARGIGAEGLTGQQALVRIKMRLGFRVNAEAIDRADNNALTEAMQHSLAQSQHNRSCRPALPPRPVQAPSMQALSTAPKLPTKPSKLQPSFQQPPTRRPPAAQIATPELPATSLTIGAAVMTEEQARIAEAMRTTFRVNPRAIETANENALRAAIRLSRALSPSPAVQSSNSNDHTPSPPRQASSASPQAPQPPARPPKLR
jgi:hypothetical protein